MSINQSKYLMDEETNDIEDAKNDDLHHPKYANVIQIIGLMHMFSPSSVL